MHISNIHTCDSIPFDSRHAAWVEEGLKSLLHATYVFLILSQGNQGIPHREQSLLLAMKQWVGTTTAFLPSSQGLPTPLQGMTRLSMRPRKGKALCWFGYRLYSQIPTGSDTKWLSKGKPGTQSGMPSGAAAQLGSFPRSLQWNKATDHLPLHICPWRLYFGRWA